MKDSPGKEVTSRRDFLKTTSTFAAASALAGITLPAVHAQGSDVVNVALIGCGGRGTGAAGQAMSTKAGPVKLTAMADVFPSKLRSSYEGLKNRFKDQVDVPADRQFIGFDAYRQAMDSLKPGDVAIFTTPPAFRWVNFKYAIEKGLNVFMEKPVTVDGPSSRKMLALNEEAKKKNLKVGVGLMIRHCRRRQELFNRIQDGEVGELTMMRAYRMHGPAAFFESNPKPEGISDLMYQIQRFHSFLWASGGSFSDFLIHNIDETCWMKNAWPVRAQASGGRHYRGNKIDQNFDNYSVEYTFADGTKFFMYGRNINGCHDEFASYAHGTKGLAIISSASHAPSRARTFKGHNITRANVLWSAQQPEPDPYQLEWDDLMEAIRNNKPFNEVQRGVEASVVTSMGRMAAHTGQVITFDQMLNCEHEFAPELEKLTFDSPAPLKPLADGKYPVPMPGILRNREYEDAKLS